MNATTNTVFDPALAFFAKFIVAATFALIFIGGLVTSYQAGMAVPDWPLSFGSLNPEGWWGNLPIRLEHGHRLFASSVGLLVTILCTWVWRNGWPLLIAPIGAGILMLLAKIVGVPKIAFMYIGTEGGMFAAAHFTKLTSGDIGIVGILGFAVVFTAALLWMAKGCWPSTSHAVRWVVLAAFVGVSLQATLGGLRVTMETANNLHAAMILRIVHACVAQAELGLLVAVATLLSRSWIEGAWKLPGISLKAVHPLAWLAVAAVYGQLIVGATMRHKGAGLAIPTFPEANPDGGYLPAVHNIFTDLNFTHTRFGAGLVTLLILTLALLVLRRARGEVRLTSPAIGLLGLVLVQVSLGVYVIWYVKPITLTTIHVVNGAAVLALSLLLALRAGRFAKSEAQP